MKAKTILAWVSIAISGAIGAIAGEAIKNSWPESKEWALGKFKQIAQKDEKEETI